MATDESSEKATGKRKKLRKALRITVLCIILVWAIVLAVLQIALTPSVLTGAANHFAAEYVDGNVSFGKVSVSVFRSFPFLNVSFDSLSITYPSGKFSEIGAGTDWYTRQGRGEESDTLLSVGSMSASINIAALASGKIRVPKIQLSKTRVFATSFNDSTASWNIFRLEGQDTENGESDNSGIPDIRLGEIRISGGTRVVFSSIPDSIRLAINAKRIGFDGRLSLSGGEQGQVGINIDTLFMTGRFPSDTVALKLDKLDMRSNHGRIRSKAVATAYLAMKSYGRMKLPVEVESEIKLPENHGGNIVIPEFKATVAAIPLTASAELKFKGDSVYVKGESAIDNCKVSDVLKYFGKNFWEGAKDLKTDAEISMTALFDGWFDSNGSIPEIIAELKIPESTISHKAIGVGNKLALDVSLTGGNPGKIDIDLKKLALEGRGINLSAIGTAEDILGDDPEFNVDGDFKLDMDSLSSILLKTNGYMAEGEMSAGLKGRIRLSQISPYKFAEANLRGYATSSSLIFRSDKDSINVYIDSLDMKLGTMGNRRDTSIKEGERMIAAMAYIDSINLGYKNAMTLRGRSLSLKAKNSAAILDKEDTSKFFPFGGKFEAGFLSMRDADTSFIAVVRTDNVFTIYPKKENPEIPVLTLTSKNDRLFARGPVNRIGVRDLEVTATAAMNSIERKKRAARFIDSLAKVYPDVPRDSLFRHVMKDRMASMTVPEWLSEADFRKSDIDFSLDQNLAKYFREWDMEGSVSLKRTSIMTPDFPLRNVISDATCSFNNNEIRIDSFNLRSGSSNIRAKGAVIGLKRALLRRGILNIDIDVKSDSLDLNQLLAAYSAGKEFDDSILRSTDTTEMDDEAFQEIVVQDIDTSAMDNNTLFVVPANINAAITLDANNVKYSKLEFSHMKSDLKVKERCIQFTNTAAASNVGDMIFEGFYSTRTKKDLKTGFNINFENITAEKVIEMLPAVDSLLPMLKSFKGELNCEMAATADMDTTMNIMIPSINGVIRISGKNLSLHNDESIKQLAKVLKFKDRQNSSIDKMSVEGMISDSKLEIFPFILNIDRYTLAMSGIQNLDSSFKYHISVIESPMVFRIGVDLSGDFEDMKVKVGKAKYKSTNIPVFSSVVDQTKLNLAESIRNIFQKGVDEAVRENERQTSIKEYKDSIGYVQAVEEKLDSLSVEEKRSIEEDN